jgi:hypothetical protein
LRRVPMFLSTVTYPGTTVVKEVVIDVFRRSVKREEVADRDGFAFIAAPRRQRLERTPKKPIAHPLNGPTFFSPYGLDTERASTSQRGYVTEELPVRGRW